MSIYRLSLNASPNSLKNYLVEFDWIFKSFMLNLILLGALLNMLDWVGSLRSKFKRKNIFSCSKL